LSDLEIFSVIIGLLTLTVAISNFKKMHQPSFKFTIEAESIEEGFPKKNRVRYVNVTSNCSYLVGIGTFHVGKYNVNIVPWTSFLEPEGDRYSPFDLYDKLKEIEANDLKGLAESIISAEMSYSYKIFPFIGVKETYRYKWDKRYNQWLLLGRDSLRYSLWLRNPEIKS
jgi:hypothetical protein